MEFAPRLKNVTAITEMVRNIAENADVAERIKIYVLRERRNENYRIDYRPTGDGSRGRNYNRATRIRRN